MHFRNALSPTSLTESGTTTDLSELHMQKAYFSIFLIPDPNRNSSSPMHFRNAPSPITSTESGMATAASEEHPLKALSSILLIPAPNRNSSSPTHPLKAALPTTSTVSGISTETIDLHFQNAFLPISTTGIPSIRLGISNAPSKRLSHPVMRTPNSTCSHVR